MIAPVEKSPHECWLDVLGLVDTALTARPAMHNAPSVAERNGARRVYVEAVDKLIDTLEAMARRGHLNDIGAFLDVQFGRV
ncbi:hypothetical protein EGN72_02630 [Pseudorhodobacter sp. E13]|uniref:hypothetical protein n=1 Tax=Pseudorhodobacter sp. E13 TaxID=2487931 RepID=UPI000F8DFDC1|nr:hypothetical protein [Pseudorhodobacter sp. E13]RUS64907.1 hypothetical protein EGN72_02630 [Pseudorhodobacter sp. E13]